ncbi:DUF2336 domain-containing protein [Brevundimonas sp. 2R-24]|uniref:DUF2336 domain-containing protein n=1 Tax=Peiella sedimenti TaxID=3061083 RepID=A0ABT8SHN9_9CAUL|nr:DUF2336 domain-containing protein [Caulobacteraceae bacterium XZ-24]
MTDPAEVQESAPPTGRARRALLKRLADVVSLPESRVNAFERSVVGDLLVEILSAASAEERGRVAARITGLSETPASLVRLFLRDEMSVAGPFIEDCASLSDADLIACALECGPEHRIAIARRKHLSEAVGEVIIGRQEAEVMTALAHNPTAKLSQSTLELMVAASRDLTELVPLLLKRPELRPAGAYVMFWWADAAGRRLILSRFAVSREVMQEAVGDIFAAAAEEGWSDPLARKALQFIERRQRNRAAVDKSPFDSLDQAVAAAEAGMTPDLAREIGYLAGVKPTTAAKILSDKGGEPIAIVCKATGLPKSAALQIWRGLRRPETNASGETEEALDRMLTTYDMMSVDRAQTVLRYWNWSLSSALTPALLKAIREGDESGFEDFTAAQKAALLAFSTDL